MGNRKGLAIKAGGDKGFIYLTVKPWIKAGQPNEVPHQAAGHCSFGLIFPVTHSFEHRLNLNELLPSHALRFILYIVKIWMMFKSHPSHQTVQQCKYMCHSS